MKPAAKFHGFHEQSKKVINGPRPSPLMINKDSHVIRKPSVSSTCVVAETKQQRDPIIIYTQSPKVIHTKAQDFMALVQRLTGMSSSNEEVPHQPHQEASEKFGSSLSDGSKSNNSSIRQQKQLQWKQQDGASDGDETSSALRTRRDDETCVQWGAYVQHSPSPSNLGFADMPLFTPNSSDFFCSSRSVYKYSDSPYGILGSLISPSGLEFIKKLPEY